MRRQLLCLAILLATAGVYAIPPPEQEKASREAAAEVVSDSGEQARNKSTTPAASFTPTETIDADSAVSFPVDI